ncbi:MAG TPA: type II toxin-antitoxin system VapC family toxin [Candidatus Limnocylindria bacterium]|nr:type II toxin-antitoxin system VapC family toxin [Candidatus Limnocylindria bacterium]
MSFILDTCALSELTRPATDRKVAAWFDAQEPGALYLSVLTVGEIEKDIAALRPGRKRTALTGWLATLRSTYAERILPIDAPVATIWGRVTALVERRGGLLGVVDGLIAATALHHGYTVVTKAPYPTSRANAARVCRSARS